MPSDFAANTQGNVDKQGLGLVYIGRQRCYSVNAAMMLATLLSLNTMESLQNGLQPHSGVTPSFSMEQRGVEGRVCVLYYIDGILVGL